MSKLFFNVRKVVSILLIVTLVLSTRGTFVFAEGISNANANAGEEMNEEFEPAEELVDSDEAEKKDDLVDSEKEEASEEETEKEEAEEETEKEETEKEEASEEETEKEETEKDELEKEESEKEESEKEESEVAEEEKKEEEKVEEEIATTSEATEEDNEQVTDEEKADEAKTDDQIVDEDNEATPSDAEKVDNKETFGAGESSLASHDNSWTAVDNAGLETVLLAGKKANVYLTEDATINYELPLDLLLTSNINVCLHGNSLTLAEGFSVREWAWCGASFTNCDTQNKANVYFNFSGSASNKAPYRDGKMSFSNVNIISNDTLNLENIALAFDNCTFEISASNNELVNAVASIIEFSNLNIEEQSAGFVFDNTKAVFNTVSMKNNTVNTLIKATNKSEVTIKGKSIYEGNKNIYYIDNSKLFVVNGSGHAKDVLREVANEEYTDKIVTKKTTKLLDPDSNNISIVYKRNTGSYVMGAKNAEIEFDGVIVANEFIGNDNRGAYVNLGGGKSKLTLLNRAYVNQNSINIVATSNDEFYGSKENSDGTRELLNRDATLSFYPMEDGLTLLRDVIKRDENSNILTARDFKTDDEWHFIVEAFFYKACMIQDYTDDTYKREPLPYGKDVVYCNIEEIGKGEQKGTFYMAPRTERTNIIRFHLGEGVQEYVSWQPGKWDITDIVELEYIPSFKDNDMYSINFKENFNEVQPKWIDKTIPNEPYEYTFRGWSTTKDNLIVPMESRKDVSIGYLEKGVDSILDKFGKYDYFDVLDLYACWWGDLKITYVFKAEERVLDTENPLKIEKWTEKKIIGRSNHPFTLPTYVKGEDYIYDHFTVVGWQKHSYEDINVDYTITWLGPKLAQGDQVTETHNSWGVDYEYKEVRYYALFEGDTYKVNWYLNSEGIKEVNAQFLKDGMNADGFYQEEVKLGGKYSRINPVIDDSFLTKVYTNFTLDSGVEFLGWTKEEIKKPLTDEELYEVVGEGENQEKKLKVTLVKDYLIGYSTLGDSYYYPVLHYTPDVAEHPGNIALTQSYIDTQVVLGGVNTVEVEGVMVSRDTYEVTTDLKMNKALEIIGDVTIDLHGHELYLEGGAYFYGDGNLTFTDCKHDEVKPKDRGSIYNDNGVIYKGSGNLKFNRMTFRGKQAHRFEALDNEVIIDDVELREEEFNQLLGDPYGDRYPRLMQIDNSTVHIKNTTMDNIDGKIVVMNGGHLELTNFTMINCRRPEKHLDELQHIVAKGGSEIIVNSPCWFENNADIFTLEDSYLEIKSDFGKISSLEELDEDEVFTGDFDEIKDSAVIFTKNVYEAIIKTQRSDVRLSGIFYKNKTRLPIVTEYNSGKKSVTHFNGYIYVKDNTDSVNNYSDMGMFGNIKYIQEENDFINPLSEMDYYTFYWSSHFRCDPYACREYKILENLSVEEFEGLNNNRYKDGERKGQLKTFTLKNSQNGYNGNYYRPIIDGINFNEETGRGYDVVFNYENELSIIDLNFKNEAGLNCIKFKDMEGKLVDNATIQFDKRTEESRQKFIDWWNSLEFTSTDNRLVYDSMYRQNPVSLSEERISLDQILRATASMRIVLKTRRAEDYPYDKFFVTYDMNFPLKPDGTDFNGRKDPASNDYLIEPEVRHDNNGGSKYNIDDWYEIKGVRYLDNAENSYPFTFVGWEYVYGGNTYSTKQFNDTDDAQAATEVEQNDGGKTYLFKPGEKYQLGRDFPRYYGTQFALKAKWEPKEVNIVYKLNKYLKYKGIGEDYVQRAKVGEYADILDIRNIEVDNRFVFTGWYMKNPAPIDAQWNTLEGARWMMNGMELQDNMIPDGRFASQNIQDFRKLGSKLYIDEYKKDLFGHTNSLYDVTEWQGDYNKDWIIYPIYYPKDDTVKRWVLEETIKYYDAVKKATQSDTYKTIEDSHFGYTSTFYYFYRSNNTLSGNTSIGEDVELAADITINGDVTLDLHGHRFVVTTGKFIIPEGSSLTINNCKTYGGFAFGDNTISEGEGQIKLSNIYIHDIDNTLLFDNSNVYFSNVKMNDIQVKSGNLFELKNGAKLTIEKLSFNGLKAGFDVDSGSYLKLVGVSVKNSTVDVLFKVRNKSKVDISKYIDKSKIDYVNSIFENNKNIALVDDSKFMITAGEEVDKDTQNDVFMHIGKGPIRNPYVVNLDGLKGNEWLAAVQDKEKNGSRFWPDRIYPLGKKYDNELNENNLQRVIFRNNKGNYIFGAQNNAEVFFNGIAIFNEFTENSDGKMGAYVNLDGSKNTLVLRNNPYINQNTRNIVVTDNDFITCHTEEPEYQHGKTLSKDATLSFYITQHKTTRMFVGTEESWKVEPNENPFGTDNYIVYIDGIQRDNYIQPSCMIEGYRDTLFTFYGEDYAGNKMNLEFRQDEEDPTIKGFYAVPDDTKDKITIKLHANGGALFSVDENGNPITYYDTDEEGNITQVYSCVNADGTIDTDLKDAKGNKDRDRYTPKILDDERYEIVTEYEFVYPRFEWTKDYWEIFMSSIKPVRVEKTDIDAYVGDFRGWLYDPQDDENVIRYLGTYDIIDNTHDVTVYAQYYFPPIATITYRIEKGGAENLRGIAYEIATESVVTEIVSKFRLETGISADIEAPGFDELTVIPINGWKMGSQWLAEDNPSQPKIAPGANGVRQAQRYTTINKDAHYYIEWIDPNKKPQPARPVYIRPTNNSGGTGGSGGSGSGDAPRGSLPSGAIEAIGPGAALANMILNVQAQAQQAQQVANEPTANNPFALATVVNELGQVQVLTAEETGRMQVEKASLAIQAALTNATGVAAKVSETNLSANDSSWTKNAEGKWVLNSNTAGQVKDTWQQVTDANGVGSWYKFDANGNMQTGWITDGNKVFYLIESGASEGQMVRGAVIDIGGYQFKFNADGSLDSMGIASINPIV